MKIRLYYILVAMSFILPNCVTNLSDKIELIPTRKETLQIGDIKDIIQLETTDESQLGFINKSIIDFKNDRVFILSNFNLYIFNTSGEFIHKLAIGKGPNEVIRVSSFSINPKKKRYYVLDDPNNISVFNYEGKMIEKFKYEGFSCSDIQFIDDENILLYNFRIRKGKEKTFVGIYNFNQKTIIKKFVQDIESPYPELLFISCNNFPKYGSRQFFTSPNIFGLYEFKKDTFISICSFDLGNKSVPASFSEKYLENRGRLIFGEEAILNGYVPYLFSSFYFNNYYFVILEDLNYSCFAISEKNRNKVFFNGTISAYFNLPAISSLNYPTGYCDNSLIFSCSPLDFFENDEIQNPKEIEIGNYKIDIQYDSNPFLIVVN